MGLIAPGTCRHCGCHGENCRMPDGDLCGFTDRTGTVCSAPACQRAEAARLAAAKAADAEQRRAGQRKYGDRYRGWGSGAIFADLRRRERARRKGKGKAA